ncbi:MAG: hypothetical protein ABI840_11760 [bacterium]
MINKNWEIGFLLPNLKVNENFETEFISIVKLEDMRIKKMIDENIDLRKILHGFVNEHNKKISPSVLIYDSEAPRQYLNYECFVSFRNLIAISVIFKNWANLNPYNVLGPMFSDSFDFYPMKIEIDGSTSMDTPAILSIRTKNSEFIGTSFPGVPIFNFSTNCDSEIYNALIKAWHQKYCEPGEKEKNINTLFRSVEVAFHALSMPIKNQTSINDIGISISLWISAFEILAHPINGDVKVKHVKELLNLYSHYSDELKTNNLLNKLYVKLYDSRNDFLHGNDIPKGILKLFCNKENNHHNYINNVAPVLYRIALYSRLEQLKFLEPKINGLNINNIINNQYNYFLQKLLTNEI